MLFTDLNTKVLLDIFGCLDLIDVINLAGTCTKMRDTAQLHYTVRYNVFNLNNFLADRELEERHNYVDATLVLKAIGHVISVLVTELDETQIGSDLGAAIRKYCVNVKSLKIAAQGFSRADCSCTCYSEWLKNLKLEKITLGVGDLPILDLCETSNLNELVINYFARCRGYYYSDNTTAPHVMKRIFERNHNITRLSIPLFDHFDYEVFVKLTSLKCVEFSRITKGALSKVAAKLKMSDLERVEIPDHINDDFEEVNAFLRTLAENSPRLNNLSIGLDTYHPVNKNPLHSLHLFELTSLRLCVTYPDFYNVIPKMQPNLKHLDLQTHRDVDPALQIISLTQNLKKLEILHIDIGNNSMLAVLKVLKDELDSHRILNAHSINRPALRIYLNSVDTWSDFVQVKLNFKDCKSTVIDIPYPKNYFSESIYQSVLPCCY